MTSVAPAPFNRADASFVLRSSDLVDFRVHKEILSIASPAFEGMLTIPQPSQNSPNLPAETTPTPILSLPEDSQTLDGLFRLIYPTERKRLTTVEAIGKVLEASIKYGIDSAATQMTSLLKRFSRTHPVLTYIVACKLELEEVARLAAVRALELRRRPLGLSQSESTIWVEDMSQISAASYFNLVKFLSNETSGRERAQIRFVRHPSPHPPIVPSLSTPQLDIGPWASVPPDIIIRSIDGSEFPAHKQMLSMASPVLATQIQTSINDGDHLPVLTLAEEGALLMRLIPFCYPVPDTHLGDIDSMAALLDVAAKYEIKRVAESARARFMLLDSLRQSPIRAYFLAIRFNWFVEARLAAALHVLYRGSPLCPEADEYVSEMRFAPARVYENLRVYRERCLTSLRGAILRTPAHGMFTENNKLTISSTILKELVKVKPNLSQCRGKRKLIALSRKRLRLLVTQQRRLRILNCASFWST